jgi:hypothetical protein
VDIAMTHHTGIRLAEVGFLLIALAGVWVLASQIPALRLARTRNAVAGLLLAAAGVLLIIATHWGKFN